MARSLDVDEQPLEPTITTRLMSLTGVDNRSDTDQNTSSLKRDADEASNLEPGLAVKKAKVDGDDPDAGDEPTEDPQIADFINRNFARGPEPGTLRVPIKIPTLRKNHPVLAKISVEIWSIILAHSPLDVLIKARGLSSSFRGILSYETIWKEARHQQFGLKLPDPPAGLTEAQYADLLTGKGCQGRGCADKTARRTYWAFLRRWCHACFVKNTMLEPEIQALCELYPGMVECIPMAMVNHSYRYQCIGKHEEEYYRSPKYPYSPRKAAYNRFAVEKFMIEYDTLHPKVLRTSENHEGNVSLRRDEDALPEPVAAWVAAQKLRHTILTNSLQSIEKFAEEKNRSEVINNTMTKKQRVKYFARQAASLDPPISFSILARMPSFLRAASIPKPPTELSWQALLPKLRSEQAEVQEIQQEAQDYRAHWERLQDKTSPKPANEKANEYADICLRRSLDNRKKPNIVLALANKVIADLAHRNIADQDIILHILRETYKAYQEMDDAQKPRGYNGGVHRLLMDDAKLVYEDEIVEYIGSLPAKEGDPNKVRLRSVKCPGCPSTKTTLSSMNHNFRSLMYHITDCHTYKVGPFRYFRVPRAECPDFPTHFAGSTGFPWCRIEWPPNLPVIRWSDKANGKWDPLDASWFEYTPVEESEGALGEAKGRVRRYDIDEVLEIRETRCRTYY